MADDVQSEVLRAVTASIFAADLVDAELLANAFFAQLAGEATIRADGDSRHVERQAALSKLKRLPTHELATAFVVQVLERSCLEWDKLAGALHRMTAPVAFPGHAIGACLRLFAVDLAFRATALAWLSRTDDERPYLDFWSRPKGISAWLKNLLFGIARDHIATELEVHPNSLDAWFDQERRPKDENLVVIAEMASGDDDTRARQLLRRLRLAYGFRGLFQRIECVVGKRQVADLCQRSVQYANDLLVFPRQSSMSADDSDLKLAITLTFGLSTTAKVPMPWVEGMTNHLHRSETDPVWRTTLRAAPGDWLSHLQEVFAILGPVDVDELFAATGRRLEEHEVEALAYNVQATATELTNEPGSVEAGLLQVAAGGKRAALELKLHVRDALAGGDRIRAIELLRTAIAHEPSDPELHFRLGASLWQVGDEQAALHELEVAEQLAPTWDRPRVEIAIVHSNAGRAELALKKLERAYEELPERAPWLLLNLAYARERQGRTNESIAVYEELLAVQPDQAEALDRVAHLYFLVGQKRKGADAAKSAKRLGIPTVFNAWKRRHYDGPSRTTRPRHVGLNQVLVFLDPRSPKG